MNTSKKYAGFYPRLLAHNIDILVLLPFFYFFGMIITNDRVLICVCFTLYFAYNLLFELTNWKGTIGKKLTQIKVENANPKSSVYLVILIRNVMKIVSIVPPFIGVLMLIFDKKNRTFHDRIAQTTVIFDKNKLF